MYNNIHLCINSSFTILAINYYCRTILTNNMIARACVCIIYFSEYPRQWRSAFRLKVFSESTACVYSTGIRNNDVWVLRRERETYI